MLYIVCIYSASVVRVKCSNKVQYIGSNTFTVLCVSVSRWLRNNNKVRVMSSTAESTHLHLRHGSFNPAEAALLQLGSQAQCRHVDGPELGLRQQTLQGQITLMMAIQATTLFMQLFCISLVVDDVSDVTMSSGTSRYGKWMDGKSKMGCVCTF